MSDNTRKNSKIIRAVPPKLPGAGTVPPNRPVVPKSPVGENKPKPPKKEK
jgi:hypothetical protein